MSNLEDQLLEYLINPESADTTSIIRTLVAEVRGLRSTLTLRERVIEKYIISIEKQAAEIRSLKQEKDYSPPPSVVEQPKEEVVNSETIEEDDDLLLLLESEGVTQPWESRETHTGQGGTSQPEVRKSGSPQVPRRRGRPPKNKN